MSIFEEELRELLNRTSQENASNTPDFILALYLLGCLDGFNRAVQQRDQWYGLRVSPEWRRTGGTCARETSNHVGPR